MSKRIAIKLVFFVLLFPFALQGQLKTQNPAKVHFPSVLRQGYGAASGVANFLGLDPAKFSMQQSFTLSFTSLNGYGLAQGVYLNTMSYQLSTPLTLSVQWGFFNNLTDPNRLSPNGSGFFISGANLEYKPSENFHIGVQYSSYPNALYPDRRFRYSRWPYSIAPAKDNN